MPRKAREKSRTGIYHIIMRGINRQCIFEDEEDYIKFVQVLEQYKDRCRYELYAYCLMENHVHLLLKVGEESLAQVMRRICGSYVYWYNWKYDRIGNLFQDRFKSEPVEEDTYFLTVLRYIHQNPIKAKLVKAMEKYMWSSYGEYIGKVKMVNVDYVLEMFNIDREKAIKSFIQYNHEVNDDKCLDISQKSRITDKEARTIIKKVCNIDNATAMQNLDISSRNKYLRELKEKYYLSVRQLERLTGIGRGIVLKA